MVGAMTEEPLVSFGQEDVPPAEKTRRVRGVFTSVARNYDIMNDLMSLGIHRLWKDAAVAHANPQPGEVVIDVAGGTGDIAVRLRDAAERARARRGGRPAAIHVMDINHAMLATGARRTDAHGLTWTCANAELLPLPNACADLVTIAFGIRNVTHIDRALAEFRRVLRPGGRFVCLEFSRVDAGAPSALYDTYCDQFIPRLGAVVARDADSYRYLVESIRRFPDQRRFAEMIDNAGFGQVGFRNYSAGVAALHWGWVI